MPKDKGGHLDETDRRVIQDGIYDGLSAREIARRLRVDPSTVVREVRRNRTETVPNRKRMTPKMRCARYDECGRESDACERCARRDAGRDDTIPCKLCVIRKCYLECSDCELRTCLDTQRWPYVCTCPKQRRGSCALPKYDYSAAAADAEAARRAGCGARGPALTQVQIDEMMGIVGPLILQGQSPEAIWRSHGDELPVCSRTFYNYVEAGLTGLTALDLPRKARFKPRKGKKEAVWSGRKPRVDRRGRTYGDFMALPPSTRLSAVQLDTVVGSAGSSQRILSMHIARLMFQLYVLLADARPSTVVAALDALETYAGSPAAFKAAFGIMLADRGFEFDDWGGMERSCLVPGAKRCHVYYTDPLEPDQKPHCERNHAELRRILPKGRSDFDKLTAWDVAVACSHINSYPREDLGGACPLALASQVVPVGMLEALGVEQLPPDDVVLSPKLLPHVVAR